MKEILIAALSGLLFALGYEPFSLWYLLPFSLAILIFTLHKKSIKERFFIGFIFATAFWLVQINWLSVLSPFVLLITAIALSFFYGLAAMFTFLFRHTSFWPILYGITFLTLESLFNYWPFGGFNWGSIGYISAKNPLANLASVIGVYGLSILIALLSGVMILSFLLLREGGVIAGLILILLWVLLVGFLQLLRDQQPDLPAKFEITVGAVQGNVPRLGLEFNAQRKAVYQNHIDETFKLIAGNSDKDFDLIVWPENAPDVDPFNNSEVIKELNQLSLTAASPILVGSRMQSKIGPVNGSILITGDTSYENAFYYAKKKLVPFGERVPFENFLGPIAVNFGPISESLVPGKKAGILKLSEGVRIGLLICFEVAWGQLAKDVIDQGADVIIVQTNNATYGLTTQLPQQFNIAKLRAIESQKQVLTVATSGISGLVDKNGKVLWEVDEFTSASEALDLKLYPGSTLGLFANYYLQLAVFTFFIFLATFFGYREMKHKYVE